MASNSISILIKAKDEASRAIDGVGESLDGASERSGKFGTALASMGKTLGGAVIALGAAGAAAAGAGAVIGFKFDSSVEQATAKLNAFMKDGDKVAATLAWVKDEAAATQFSFTEMADAAANLTPVARSSGQSLEALVKQAEILAALNPTEGLTGATFSLREALSGDWVSIVDRFNLPRQRINELKAEGVPAMEIISRTLNEMGIDYGLVAAQGATVAARFDQIKDKLTMLAGTATKPIFDLVSQGLDRINQFDGAAWGERMAHGVQIAIGALKLFASGDFKRADWLPGIEEDDVIVVSIMRIRNVLIEAVNYIKPAFDSLVSVFSKELGPALGRLAIELAPIAGSLGKILVVAIRAAIGAIAALASALSHLINFSIDLSKNWQMLMENLPRYLKDAVGGVGDLWNGLVETIQTGVARIQAGIDQVGLFFQRLPEAILFGIGAAAGHLFLFAAVTVPAFINSTVQWFEQLPGRIGAAMQVMAEGVSAWFTRTSTDAQMTTAALVESVGAWFASLPTRVGSGLASFWASAGAAFESFKNSAVQWAQNTVNDIVRAFTDLPARVGAKVEEALKGARGFFNDAGATIANGFNSVVSNRHALGTNFAPGGATLVGEHGPELVNLPAGSQVAPAWQTAGQGAGSGAGALTIQISGDVILQNAAAVDSFFKQADQAQRFARMGMA